MHMRGLFRRGKIIIAAVAAGVLILAILAFIILRQVGGARPISVTVQAVSPGAIYHDVCCTGTVADAEAGVNVTGEATGVVQSIQAELGAEVQAGDVLFTLGETENQALAEAQEELDRLNDEYQQMLLEASQASSSSDQTVQRLQNELKTASARRDAAAVTTAEQRSLANARSEMSGNSAEIAQIDISVQSLTGALSEISLDEAQYDVSRWEESVAELQAQVDRLQADISGMDGADLETLKDRMDTASAEAEAAAEALKEATGNYQTAQAELDAAKSSGAYQELEISTTYKMREQGVDPDNESMRTQYRKAVIWAADSTTAVQYNEAYAAVQSAQMAYDTARASYDSAFQRNESASAALKAANDAYAQATESTDSLSTLKAQLTVSQRDLDAAESELADAKAILETLEADYNSIHAQITEQSARKAELEARQKTLAKTISTIEAKQKNYQALADEAVSCQQRLSAALAAQEDGEDNRELAEKQSEIDQQQELVAQYSSTPMSVDVRAPSAGTVYAIYAQIGEEVLAGSVLAVLTGETGAYTVQASVAGQQAETLHVGDLVECVDSSAEATVTEIVPSGQDEYTVTFRINEALEPGTSITLTIGREGETFDVVVPGDILREDEDGIYVLVALEKNTPLGIQYYAARVAVQVLDRDDTSVALSGLLADDRVIIDPDQTVQDGDRIQMRNAQ